MRLAFRNAGCVAELPVRSARIINALHHEYGCEPRGRLTDGRSGCLVRSRLSRMLPAMRHLENTPAPEKTSGRVSFDSRGNAVWEWSMATGKFRGNVDTERLKNSTPI